MSLDGHSHGTSLPRAERGLGTRRVHNCNPASALEVAGLALEDPSGPSAHAPELVCLYVPSGAWIGAARVSMRAATALLVRAFPVSREAAL
jgi:hypothetical protein